MPPWKSLVITREAIASPWQRGPLVLIKEEVQSHLSLFTDSILSQSCNLKQLSQPLFPVIIILGAGWNGMGQGKMWHERTPLNGAEQNTIQRRANLQKCN